MERRLPNSSWCPMNDFVRGFPNIDVLNSESNKGYLPQPIPIPRDDEIKKLLLETINEGFVARLRGALQEGHAAVLRAFAERMASLAVRLTDEQTLRLGLIALLLTWNGPDSRNTLLEFPLFYDAITRLGLAGDQFVVALRPVLGDELIAPFASFLSRPEAAKTLQSMGYAVGADNDGFRYLRKW